MAPKLLYHSAVLIVSSSCLVEGVIGLAMVRELDSDGQPVSLAIWVERVRSSAERSVKVGGAVREVAPRR
ncbi:hypothetical protein GCM10020216_034390 [Nonomuraea helvata]